VWAGPLVCCRSEPSDETNGGAGRSSSL
jgi:hypothetical protein